MKTQIIYVLVSAEKDVFLEELWVSVWSLRRYEPDVTVNVIVDEPTAKRVKANVELMTLITNVVVADVPEKYTPKERSREIKTRIRELIKGDFFYIDTDTVICKPLGDIDDCEYDVAGIPDSNVFLKDNPFAGGMISSVKEIFGSDVSNCEYLINGGVIYAKDNDVAHELFSRWNKNWTYSCFEKGNSQDQPALWQSDHEMGNVIKLLPDVYNSQVAMSLQYFSDAAIVHFLHMNFIPDQSYSPYLSLKIYKDIKTICHLTPEIKDMIINCKSSFAPLTMPVGRDQLMFLFTPMGKAFVQIYKEGGTASWLMLKMCKWLEKFHKITCKNK
jgi:hypothetical protein